MPAQKARHVGSELAVPLPSYKPQYLGAKEQLWEVCVFVHVEKRYVYRTCCSFTAVRQPTTTHRTPSRSVMCKVSMIARTAGLSAPLPTKLLKSTVEHAQEAVFFSFSAALSFS